MDALKFAQLTERVAELIACLDELATVDGRVGAAVCSERRERHCGDVDRGWEWRLVGGADELATAGWERDESAENARVGTLGGMVCYGYRCV